MAANDSTPQGSLTRTEKQCRKCGVIKPIDQFLLVFRKTRPNPCRQSYCRQCSIVMLQQWIAKNRHRATAAASRRRRIRRFKHHGISEQEFAVMLASQGGVCAICGRHETQVAKRGYCKGQTLLLSIDHDHGTGRVRQLLCTFCNSMIGYAREDPTVLVAAAAYLRKHQRPA